MDYLNFDDDVKELDKYRTKWTQTEAEFNEEVEKIINGINDNYDDNVIMWKPGRKKIIKDEEKEYKIYKITNILTNKIYIGSTSTKFIYARLAQHVAFALTNEKINFNINLSKYPTNKFKAWIYDIVLNGDDPFKILKIEIVEKKKCSYKEILNLERHYILKFDSINTGYNAILP